MAHEHIITDHDKHFIIDPVTRKIMPETHEKNKLVEGDHNSEKYTFEIPKTIEGHDMNQCNVVQIHYLNVSSDKSKRVEDIYDVDDLGILEDKPDTLAFTWTIKETATRYSGLLSFAITFKCTTDNTVDYAWHTEIYSGITIGTGMNNAEAIVIEYSDILEEWRQKLFSTYETVINISLPTNNWVQSPDLTHYTQDITISGVTANTKIDLQPSPEQLVSMINGGIVMFVANDNGNVKVYSVNEKPTEDMTIQATVKETKI